MNFPFINMVKQQRLNDLTSIELHIFFNFQFILNAFIEIAQQVLNVYQMTVVEQKVSKHSPLSQPSKSLSRHKKPNYFHSFRSLFSNVFKKTGIHQFFLSFAASKNFFFISSAVLILRLRRVSFIFFRVTLSSLKSGACVSLRLSSFLILIVLADLSRSCRQAFTLALRKGFWSKAVFSTLQSWMSRGRSAGKVDAFLRLLSDLTSPWGASQFSLPRRNSFCEAEEPMLI